MTIDELKQNVSETITDPDLRSAILKFMDTAHFIGGTMRGVRGRQNERSLQLVHGDRYPVSNAAIALGLRR